MSGIVGSAVSDKMKYAVKQAAVRSENALRNIKASNGTEFSQNLGTEIVFELPSNSNGSYCDFSKSYFRFTLEVDVSEVQGVSHAGLYLGHGQFFYERGPESMFRRIQIYDASGTLLENLEHYNEIYAVQELLTSTTEHRVSTGYSFHEGWNDQVLEKNFPDLGGTVVMGNNKTITTAAGYSGDKDAYKVAQMNQSALAITGADAKKATFDVTFQLSSAMFGGSAQKYLPFTAVNGLRMVMTLDSINNTFNSTTHLLEISGCKIRDPTFFYDVIRVDPMVDASLIASARGEDGLIRIHTQTWSHFSHTLPYGCTSDEFVIPVRVSSLKAIFFGFTSNKQGQNVNTIRNVDASDELKFAKFCFANMKSAFIHNGLTDYQFFVDGQPQPSTPVRVGRCQNYTNKVDDHLFVPSHDSRGSGEHMIELARAVHHGLKSLDGGHLSLLNGTYDKQYGRCGRNQLYGMEFESFSEKSNVIESGTNTLNSNVTLRMNFDPENAYINESSAILGGVEEVNRVGVYSTGETMSWNLTPQFQADGTTPTNDLGKLNVTPNPVQNLRVFCLYDSFILLDPATGIIRTEI